MDDINKRIDALLSRVIQSEQEIHTMQSRLSHHDLQIENLLTTVAALSQIKDEIKDLSAQIKVDNVTHTSRINTIVATGIGGATVLGWIISNLQAIKTIIGG